MSNPALPRRKTSHCGKPLARLIAICCLPRDPAGQFGILARRHGHDGRIEFVHADLLACPFRTGSFSMVTCVAALHHMDPVAALAAMSKLLVPGGILVIVGLARSRPPDWPLDAAAVVINLGYRMAKGYWEQPSPTVWPPPHSYREIRALATEALPGVSYRRHLLCGGTPWSGSSQHPKTWAVLEIGHSYDPAAGVLRRCSSHGRGAGQVTERSIGK